MVVAVGVHAGELLVNYNICECQSFKGGSVLYFSDSQALCHVCFDISWNVPAFYPLTCFSVILVT